MLLLPFHVGFVENPGIWSWQLEPAAITGIAVTAFLYFRWIHHYRLAHPGEEFVSRRQQVLFVAGLATFAIAMLSPVDPIGSYLLSMHMVQHVLLALIGPPLLLMGMPKAMYVALSNLGQVWTIWRKLTQPVLAFLLFNGFFSAIHLPILYNLILRVEVIHVAAHLLLMGTAFLSWWSVLAPGREFGELPQAIKSLYLLAHTVPGQIVGGVITLASSIIYVEYTHAPQRLWGLSLKTDQEIGGLIMWTFMGTFYLTIAAIAFYRWAAAADNEERKRLARAGASR